MLKTQLGIYFTEDNSCKKKRSQDQRLLTPLISKGTNTPQHQSADRMQRAPEKPRKKRGNM